MTRFAKSHLRIVWDKDAKTRKTARAYRRPMQLELFSISDTNIITYVEGGILSANSLLSILDRLKPLYVLDLRLCPRFDFPGYSRRNAFEAFQLYGSRYIAPDSEIEDISSVVSGLTAGITGGPILVITDPTACIDAISRAIPKPKDGEWDIAIEKGEGEGGQTISAPKLIRH